MMRPNRYLLSLAFFVACAGAAPKRSCFQRIRSAVSSFVKVGITVVSVDAILLSLGGAYNSYNHKHVTAALNSQGATEDDEKTKATNVQIDPNLLLAMDNGFWLDEIPVGKDIGVNGLVLKTYKSDEPFHNAKSDKGYYYYATSTRSQLATGYFSTDRIVFRFSKEKVPLELPDGTKTKVREVEVKKDEYTADYLLLDDGRLLDKGSIFWEMHAYTYRAVRDKGAAGLVDEAKEIYQAVSGTGESK